jgi:hypothetical protein
MTGRYLIYTPAQSGPNERRFDSAWRRFAEICRSLHRDGLTYSVQLNLTGATPHVLITAEGTVKPRKPGSPHRSTLPPPIPAQRCRERALEVEWFLPECRERRNNATTYWQKRQARYLELSQMAEELLRAERDFWRELELLSGQRQHFKPGISEGIINSDDGVAA